MAAPATVSSVQAGQIELLEKRLKAAEEKSDRLRDENAVLRYKLGQ